MKPPKISSAVRRVRSLIRLGQDRHARLRSHGVCTRVPRDGRVEVGGCARDPEVVGTAVIGAQVDVALGLSARKVALLRARVLAPTRCRHS